MLNWLGSKKHPKGPNWASAREHVLDLSGSRFYFTVPAHTDSQIPFKPEPETYNIYDASGFWKSAAGQGNSSIHFLEGGFASSWLFKGFALFGAIGSLDLGISIVRNSTFGSLYKSEHFMAALNQQLNYRVGPLSGTRKGRYQTRHNWSLQRICPTAFACYDEWEGLDVSRFCKIPISDAHYISVEFRKHIYQDDARIPLHQAYDALINKIIASIRIEWSADALAQQAAAKQQWPDDTLPATLPELVWSDEEWLAAESDEDREHRELLKEVAAIHARNGDMPA